MASAVGKSLCANFFQYGETSLPNFGEGIIGRGPMTFCKS
jgi:hypothetical protein